jgi:peptidoglycan/xylan/chitin deacetylase (PgdA/CDA1 family)
MGSLNRVGKHVLQQWLLPHTFLWHLPRGADCALTFDDGPHPEVTPRLLDLLSRHRVSATFFVIGESAAKVPELTRRIVQEGHAIGSHTYSHRELPELSVTEMWHELSSCRILIRDLTGVDTRLVRPPRGRVSTVALLRMMRWGYRLVHWSKTYSDYLQDGREPLLRRIRTEGLEAGDIALFHDNNTYTCEALTEMLPQWRDQGRRFVRLL